MEDRVIFEDDSYQVRLRLVDRNAPFVITFSPWNSQYDPLVARDFNRAFGIDAISALGLNTVAFVTSRNDWYQGKSAKYAVEAINAEIPPAARVVTYGSSMGAFAAINFAAPLDADYFISLSPQASISSAYLDSIGDRRWQKESAALVFNNDYIISGLARQKSGLIFFDDKFALDEVHAKECASMSSGELIPISYSGHASAAVVNKVYGLKKLLVEVCHERLVLHDLSLTIAESQKDSIEFLASHIELLEEFCARYMRNPRGITRWAVHNYINTISEHWQDCPPSAVAFGLHLLRESCGLFKNRKHLYNDLVASLNDVLSKRDFCPAPLKWEASST